MRTTAHIFQLSYELSNKQSFSYCKSTREEINFVEKLLFFFNFSKKSSGKMACRRFIANCVVSNSLKSVRSLPALSTRAYSTDKEEITKPTHTGQVQLSSDFELVLIVFLYVDQNRINQNVLRTIRIEFNSKWNSKIMFVYLQAFEPDDYRNVRFTDATRYVNNNWGTFSLFVQICGRIFDLMLKLFFQ